MTATAAELLMAEHLRELGLHFIEQYRYAPPRKFRADFAVWRVSPPIWEDCGYFEEDYRLCLIEITGGATAWGKKCPLCGRTGRGAHGSITGVKADNARLYHGFKNGWGMLRFTPQQVETGEAKQMLEEALR